MEILSEVHAEISRLLRSMPRPSVPAIETYGLVGALNDLVEEEFSTTFDEVRWQIAPKEEEEISRLPQLQAEVTYYAAREVIRNAARHGRQGKEERPLTLAISLQGDEGFALVIEDDGVGLTPDLEPAEKRGQGLALHSTMMAVVGGSLTVESEPGEFTRVILRLR